MPDTAVQHVDVLIVGAGISGIGAAYHLQDRHPGRTYTILEARDTIGGTWDLMRYPGIRSDSDLATFGYAFKPWTHKQAIASADLIRDYLREAVDENDIERHIRFHHRVTRVEWSTPDTQWTIHAERTDTGESVVITASWLFCASGYYRYDQGYTPNFEGRERFGGEIVHPQHWPEGLDYAGKRVVVIGSGATAVTLVPAMAETAGHVTMLQRSPSYVLGAPAVDPLANLQRLLYGDARGHEMTRRRNTRMGARMLAAIDKNPERWKRIMVTMTRLRLPRGYDYKTHFTPSYFPWQQRVCLAPDGDIFKAIKAGKATVATDHIETFTETGIQLKSGTHLDADIIVTATGLDLLPFGGVTMLLDGDEIDIHETYTFKGMMLAGVPNFAYALGYTNASWTLKVDIACTYLNRLLHYMDNFGYAQCVPEGPPADAPDQPVLSLTSGYVVRALDRFPRASGADGPWGQSMNYLADVELLVHGPVTDHMRFASEEDVRESLLEPAAAAAV